MLTTVPAAMLGLLALAGTAYANEPDVYIADGPPPEPLPDEFFSVGFSRDDDESQIDGEISDQGNGMYGETYAVRCMISVATGDVSPVATNILRSRCATLLELFIAAFRGGLPNLPQPLSASLGSFSWTFGPANADSGGTFAEVEFSVNVSIPFLGTDG